ncbi:MAG: hypothetical protein ACC608_11860 [Anaerofustis sp.]
MLKKQIKILKFIKKNKTSLGGICKKFNLTINQAKSLMLDDVFNENITYIIELPEENTRIHIKNQGLIFLENHKTKEIRYFVGFIIAILTFIFTAITLLISLNIINI